MLAIPPEPTALRAGTLVVIEADPEKGRALVAEGGWIAGTICANAGLTRLDVHRTLCAIAGRKIRDLRDGGNWRRERALHFPFPVDPDDDDVFIPAIKDPRDLQLIVAGYDRELWLWLLGERTWAQCADGLAGRVRRRLP